MMAHGREPSRKHRSLDHTVAAHGKSSRGLPGPRRHSHHPHPTRTLRKRIQQPSPQNPAQREFLQKDTGIRIRIRIHFDLRLFALHTARVRSTLTQHTPPDHRDPAHEPYEPQQSPHHNPQRSSRSKLVPPSSPHHQQLPYPHGGANDHNVPSHPHQQRSPEQPQ